MLLFKVLLFVGLCTPALLSHCSLCGRALDGLFADMRRIVQEMGSMRSQLDRLSSPGISRTQPAASCADVLLYNPGSRSGYYWIDDGHGHCGHAAQQYCDMTRSCGGVTGGWMRVAGLDMTNSSHQCPSGLRQRTDSSKRTCVRNSDSAGCSSVTISTAAVGYSRVCGKVTAYQVGSPDAFHGSSIASNVVDGVSLTHGSPRHHIWTFAAALDEVSGYPSAKCPCISPDSTSRPPAFVGNDYFCDTGSSGFYQIGTFYGDDPLWDGAGCGPQNTCCSFNNPPWFSKQLPQPTTDDIEMRVCRNQDRSDEDIAIETVEIYVQ